ncbi:MAG: PilZ domain-containing protein [Hyphomicrobium sp.]|jgi:PilZ domain|nr:PilZ domain-containing protein [Hyphomicrobium sp.]
MTTAFQTLKETAVLGAQPATDKRRHKRVAITLLGRFMRANRHEYPCRLNDISVGGAAINSPVAVDEGERIVVYFDHIGGLEGSVVRVFEGGFAMQFRTTARKREKLAAQLTWLINRDVLSDITERRHERGSVADQNKTVLLDTGETVDCEVVDVSISGASLRMDIRPPIGSSLMLGRMRGRVMRHHEHGIGVQFVDIQEPEALRRHFT